MNYNYRAIIYNKKTYSISLILNILIFSLLIVNSTSIIFYIVFILGFISLAIHSKWILKTRDYQSQLKKPKHQEIFGIRPGF